MKPSAAGKPPYRMSLGERYTNFVQRRRDEACFVFWGLGMAVAWARGSAVADLARMDPAPAALLAWALVLGGVGTRIWAAGNLRKNDFTEPAGPYVLVRHPLYLGTLLVSLGFFLSLGMPVTGLVLWFALLAGVFYPVLRKEELELRRWFPKSYARYQESVPRLFPRVVPAVVVRAAGSSRFSIRRARGNFGLRALWFVALVPALTGGLRWLISRSP